jgi:sulfide:quinone oxidoreductase
VYIGALETEEACAAWKQEFSLDFPVIPDTDGTLFRALTNGWVPWSILVGRDGTVLFSENEFDESGFAAAIHGMYARRPAPKARRVARAARCTVVLGGGTGGLVAARELRDRLPSGHRVVLVDRAAEHVYQPSLLWQMVGQRRQEQFTRPLDRLRRRGIEFRRAEVEAINLDESIVGTTSGDLAYESLVVSLGAQLAPEAVSGFPDMALNLYSTDGCARIRTALDTLTEGTVGILIPSMPYKCPAAPYEAAFLTEAFLRRKGIRRKVKIHLFTPEHAPMPVAPATLGEKVADMLAARGIEYHPLFTFQELRPGTREVVASNGSAHTVDVLMCVPPHQVPEVVRASPLLGVTGFVHVDPKTLETDYPGVFAIGDVVTIKMPNGKALPKAGVFAHAEAKTVARRIAAADEGKTPEAVFNGKGYCWIELGDGRAGFAGGDFYAMPEPRVAMRRPSRPLHWGKVAFEKWWLHHWFR